MLTRPYAAIMCPRRPAAIVPFQLLSQKVVHTFPFPHTHEILEDPILPDGDRTQSHRKATQHDGPDEFGRHALRQMVSFGYAHVTNGIRTYLSGMGATVFDKCPLKLLISRGLEEIMSGQIDGGLGGKMGREPRGTERMDGQIDKRLGCRRGRELRGRESAMIYHCSSTGTYASASFDEAFNGDLSHPNLAARTFLRQCSPRHRTDRGVSMTVNMVMLPSVPVHSSMRHSVWMRGPWPFSYCLVPVRYASRRSLQILSVVEIVPVQKSYCVAVFFRRLTPSDETQTLHERLVSTTWIVDLIRPIIALALCQCKIDDQRLASRVAHFWFSI